MPARRFQLVIPDEHFDRMERLRKAYGGSLSSVVRRGLLMLEAFSEAQREGCHVCVLPQGMEPPAGARLIQESAE